MISQKKAMSKKATSDSRSRFVKKPCTRSPQYLLRFLLRQVLVHDECGTTQETRPISKFQVAFGNLFPVWTQPSLQPRSARAQPSRRAHPCASPQQQHHAHQPPRRVRSRQRPRARPCPNQKSAVSCERVWNVARRRVRQRIYVNVMRMDKMAMKPSVLLLDSVLSSARISK